MGFHMKRIFLLFCVSVCLAGCSDKSNHFQASANNLIGTWRASKDTNVTLRFMPDGRAFSEDEKGSVSLGSYTVINPSNMVAVSDGGTNMVPFYFPSDNEVILQFPGKTALFKRVNSN
jgi:hypothetical protein